MSHATGSGDGEAIVEFRRVGAALKAIAVDPATGTEVSMVCDPRLSQQELARLAVQKLQFVLNKRRQGQ